MCINNAVQYRQCCTVSMRYSINAVQYQCCTVTMLYSINAVQYQCCTVSTMLYSIDNAVQYQCCTVSMLYCINNAVQYQQPSSVLLKTSAVNAETSEEETSPQDRSTAVIGNTAFTQPGRLYKYKRWLGHWKPAYDEIKTETELALHVGPLDA